MLDLNRLNEQFLDFTAYQSEERTLRAERLRRALNALTECSPYWQELQKKVAEARPKWLVAGLRSEPADCHAAVERPTPLTVVATDGSQIYPDRNVDPTCYLLNVSRIAFQYGTLERPIMESVPRFEYRSDQFDEFDEVLDKATTEVVSAFRDELELSHLLDVARKARIPGRPIVALADGTLIRWMLRAMQNHVLEQRLIERYTEVLSGFQTEGIPLCSYISMPGNTEVINLLRVHLDEDEDTDARQSLSGLSDRWLFEETLQPGERTAVFESSSHIQKEYGASDRICYFYLRTLGKDSNTEIGRVEMPAWVADDSDLLALVHATVLNECDKGSGYPMILSEAHERAIIRAREKEVFYDMIERQMFAAGLPFHASRKQASKRRPVV